MGLNVDATVSIILSEVGRRELIAELQRGMEGGPAMTMPTPEELFTSFRQAYKDMAIDPKMDRIFRRGL